VNGRRFLASAAGAWALGVLFALSGTGISRPIWLAILGSGLLLALVWLAAASAARRRSEEPRGPGWLVVPGTLLLAGLALLLAAPPGNPLFRVRFAASRAALAEAADGVLIEPPAPGGRRVGLFAFDRVEVGAGQVRFLGGACGPAARCGIVYSPLRAPATRRERYRSLGGPWYHLRQEVGR
jgi:hypothetical protein